MKPELLAHADVADALAPTLGEVDVAWRLVVIDGRRESAPDELSRALERGWGVLVLAEDDAGVVDALERGATDAMRWPATPAHVAARVRRAARLARLPWLERHAQLAEDSVEFSDTDAVLLDVNPGFERVTGYAREDVLGRTPASLFRIETVDPAYYRQIGVGLSEQGLWRGPLAARRADRSISFQQATIALVRDPTGRVVGHLAMKRDNLAASALAEIVDAVADGLLAVTADGAISRVNPALGRMLCVSPVVGEPADRLHPALGPLVRAAMAAREGRTADLELPGNRLGSASASPILSEAADRAVGCVVLVRDVTAQRQVDQMKTDFVATVSHELRTPLTSVLGFARLARSRVDRILPHLPESAAKARREAAQVADQLDIIATEGKRLAELVDDVLDLSKMEAGRVEWRRDAVSAADLVERALEATEGLFPGSAVLRVRAVAPDLPAVPCDGDRIVQVLVNLLSNAAKFTERGTITVGARRVASGVELSVADTGTGIPAADHAAIFERFRQSTSDTLTDKPKGTGLGLTIARHIVEHHGGRIGVESEPGRGSRFAFVLPAG
jgi:PAS domain S-box-containing protein